MNGSDRSSSSSSTLVNVERLMAIGWWRPNDFVSFRTSQMPVRSGFEELQQDRSINSKQHRINLNLRVSVNSSSNTPVLLAHHQFGDTKAHFELARMSTWVWHDWCSLLTFLADGHKLDTHTHTKSISDSHNNLLHSCADVILSGFVSLSLSFAANLLAPKWRQFLSLALFLPPATLC